MTSEELLLIAKVCGLVLIGCGLYIWRLGQLIDRGCPQCPHCQDNIQRENKRRQKVIEDYEKRVGLRSKDDE